MTRSIAHRNRVTSVSDLGIALLTSADRTSISRAGRRTDRPFGRRRGGRAGDQVAEQIGGYANSHDCRVSCDLRSVDRRGAGRRSWGVHRLGRATDRRPAVAGQEAGGGHAQFAQACQDSASGLVDACGPGSPALTGWSGASLTSSGFPCGLSSGFPFARRVLPLRPPSSGFPSSGVLRFVPFGRCPVPVPRRFPSGFPFP